MVVYQIGFFLLKNPYIVPMTSQIFLDSWLVSHLPIFLWFSCLLESVDNVSQFLVLYFWFQFLHFFSYLSLWFCISVSNFSIFFLFQFLVLCFFFQFLDGFFFLFCVSLSVFLFPVSVFLFSFLFKFLGCVSISSCWNLFFQFLNFFFLVSVSEFLFLFPVLDFFFTCLWFLFLFLVFFSFPFPSFWIFTLMHIHESCLLWQGLERLWIESWKLGFQCMLLWMFLGLCIPTIGSSHILIHQSYILIWKKASGPRNKWFWAADCQWPWLLARPFQAHNEVKYRSIYGASFCFPNPLTRMWRLVTTSQLLVSSFFWVCEIN